MSEVSRLLGQLDVGAFSGGEKGKPLPTQGDTLVQGLDEDDMAPTGTAVQEKKKGSDLDYLQELIAIQQSGPKVLGFFGTRNMGFLHQQLIEILSYAMVLTVRPPSRDCMPLNKVRKGDLLLLCNGLQGNHIITSGATGTNAAVIRGALRAENPELLT
eukprot:scaffold238764_cov46-Prasinocladus_malaysianus.AAC.2